MMSVSSDIRGVWSIVVLSGKLTLSGANLLPQGLVIEGDMVGWKKIKQRCKMHPTGKTVKRKQKFQEGDFKLLPDNYF